MVGFAGGWLPLGVEPLDIDPSLTAPGLAFFLWLVESGAGPPTVALALAAEPTLADGSVDCAGPGWAGLAGCIGVADGF